jgi:hypothetical protein
MAHSDTSVRLKSRTPFIIAPAPLRAILSSVKASSKAIVKAARKRRGFSSLPIGDVIAAIAALATVATIGASIVGGNTTGNLMRYLWGCVVLAVAILFVLLPMVWAKTITECKRRTFDPASIAFLQTAFDQLEKDGKRKRAAEVCLKFLKIEGEEKARWKQVPKTEREEVEPVLDFLEDAGYYLNGDVFSDELAHHNFFHWIRGWYSVLKSYIEFYQEEKDGEDERTAYCWIESLYQRTAEIEKEGTQKPKLWLTKLEDKREFLEAELSSSDTQE